jgi:hypothetical protein
MNKYCDWAKAPLMARTAVLGGGLSMKNMSAREAKDGFGRLIDTAHASPVMIKKQGRSMEEHERLKAVKSKGAWA